MAPSVKESTRVKKWQQRAELANKQYTTWGKKYSVEKLEQYYLGHQWPGDTDDYEDNYVINLFFPSIEIRKPTLYFFNPRAKVVPKPTRADDLGSTLPARAKLREDILNTLITNPDLKFRKETQLALHESHFRFGVVEVGYSADFIDNPNVGKPMLNESGESLDGTDGPVVDTRARIPERERVFVKRIPAAQFRVGIRGHNDLDRNDWCGYFEWHHVEDIKGNKSYKNNKNLKATGELKRELWPESIKNDEFSGESYKDMVLIWKIWDLRSKKRYVFAHSADGFLLEDSFDHIPFAVLKYHEILDFWYPLPPTYNWLKIQDELNETREMQRVHRRRAVRRFTHIAGAFGDGALDELIEGGDMTVVEANVENPIQPVPDAPLDGQVMRNAPATKEDFIEVSGVTGEQRGISDADTATQANIMDARTRIRENFARQEVSAWLSEILWLMLKTVEDNMSLEFPVKLSVDPLGENALMETMEVAYLWKQIKAQNLEPLSYEVQVDLEELSPVSEEARREQWNQILAILTNEKLLLLLTSSPVMLRKTMGFYGIRSEKELQEINKVAQTLMKIFTQMAAAQAGGSGGSATDPNTPDQLKNQIQSQTGMLSQ